MGRITKNQDGHFEVLIIQFGSETKKIQAQRRAAAETVARKPIEHFIHSINN